MFEHLLLPLDGSPLAERVLPHAVALAKAFGAQLTLLRVVDSNRESDLPRMINPMAWQMRKSEAEAYLDDIKKRLMAEGVKSKVLVLEGNPAQQIIDCARSQDIKLIILASHGSGGLSPWNINSVVQKVLLRAFIPVMIIRSYHEIHEELTGLTYERLFIPLDGSKRAECVLPLAKSIASAHESKIIVTHVVEEPQLPHQTPLNEEDQLLINRFNEINVQEAKRYFSDLRDQFEDQEVETIIESSNKPTATLHDIVDREKIDLVLLSAHGYSGENRWPYGDIALNFIVYGTTPLLIVQDLSENEVTKTMAEKYAEQSKGH